jgi:hypothetical protein
MEMQTIQINGSDTLHGLSFGKVVHPIQVPTPTSWRALRQLDKTSRDQLRDTTLHFRTAYTGPELQFAHGCMKGSPAIGSGKLEQGYEHCLRGGRELRPDLVQERCWEEYVGAQLLHASVRLRARGLDQETVEPSLGHVGERVAETCYSSTGHAATSLARRL